MHTKEFNIFLAIATARETEALLGVYPNILNSYHYFKSRPDFIAQVNEATDNFILDSGAFSAFTCGKSIYLDQYTEYVDAIGAADGTGFEFMTLDVIGDGLKTFAMYERFLAQGRDPIPVFHFGSDFSQLVTLCEMGIKRLAFGGLVGRGNTREFLDEAWRTVIKHQQGTLKVHGLGLTNFSDMLRYPWWSVDSSSVSGCYRFGRAFQNYDRNNRRFGGAINVHDYMRQFFPTWEDQPIGPKPNESIDGISPQCFLIEKQSMLYIEAQAHLRELRLKETYAHLTSQAMFSFCDCEAWIPVAVPDDELPLVAPPSVRLGGGASIESRQVDWDFSAHTIDTPAPDYGVPRVFALDFETFYSTEYSVKKMGAWQYTRDSRFNAYCLGIVGEERAWCGPVDCVDWERLRGSTCLVHNQGFERNCFDRLELDEIVPADIYASIKWVDTADMCAFHCYPRSLDGAMSAVFNEVLDKDVRRRLESCNCTEPEVLEYCVKDCESSYRLWAQLHDRWPVHERRISQETFRIGRGNVYVDTQKAEQWLGEIAAYLEDTVAHIPFDPPGSDKKAATFLSAEYGVEPPPNWQMTKPDYMIWKMALPSEARAWVEMREDFKKARKIYGTIEAILARTDDHERLFYELLYFGASTGRWSGAGGLNMQNWHRKARWNIRHLLVAPPGYVMGIHDFAQIEARSLLWLAGDWEQLALIREVGDVYEAHARQTMNYVNPLPMTAGDPDMRHLAKARVLALGYGCGDRNFQFMAKTLCDLELSPEVCTETVLNYRDTNSRICDLWADRESKLKGCVGGDWANPLPSGRNLHYRNIHTRRVERDWGDGDIRMEKQTFASIGRRVVGVYGGLLIENENQAFCRDIMASAWLRCVNAGYKPLMTIHDELIYLYREDQAERDLKVVDAIMSRVPLWCAGLPLGVAGELSKHYKK